MMIRSFTPLGWILVSAALPITDASRYRTSASASESDVVSPWIRIE